MCSFLPSGCHSQVGRVRRSPCELNFKGTLVECSGRGTGFPTQAIMHAYSYRRHPFSGYSNKSSREQRLKETDPAWGQVLFFPVTVVVEKNGVKIV